MRLSDAISNIYNTKWTKINNFKVYIDPNVKLIGGKHANWEMSAAEFNEKLNISLISVDTPQFTNAPIESFTGYKWRFHNSRDELYRFTMTFRDFDNLKMYKHFLRYYRAAKGQYFDDVKMEIKILNDVEYNDDIEQLVITMDDAIIENVSQIQFNNTTENQIAEFSVGFKASSVIVDNETRRTSF